MRTLLCCGLASVALLVSACLPAQDPLLRFLAQSRIHTLEETGVLNHDRIGYLPILDPTTLWQGEVIAQSNQPWTIERACEAWKASPLHEEVLQHRTTHYGLAASDRSVGGWYYIVLIVEERFPSGLPDDQTIRPCPTVIEGGSP